MANIKYRYDKEDDVLMVFLGKGKIDDAQQSGNIISHLSKKGEVASQVTWKVALAETAVDKTITRQHDYYR